MRSLGNGLGMGFGLFITVGLLFSYQNCGNQGLNASEKVYSDDTDSLGFPSLDSEGATDDDLLLSIGQCAQISCKSRAGRIQTIQGPLQDNGVIVSKSADLLSAWVFQLDDSGYFEKEVHCFPDQIIANAPGIVGMSTESLCQAHASTASTVYQGAPSTYNEGHALTFLGCEAEVCGRSESRSFWDEASQTHVWVNRKLIPSAQSAIVRINSTSSDKEFNVQLELTQGQCATRSYSHAPGPSGRVNTQIVVCLQGSLLTVDALGRSLSF